MAWKSIVRVLPSTSNINRLSFVAGKSQEYFIIFCSGVREYLRGLKVDFLLFIISSFSGGYYKKYKNIYKKKKIEN